MTAKESLNVRDGLLKMRADLFTRLIALATDRKQAENLVDQIATVDKALAATAPASAKYVRMKSASIPIKRYLDELGRAATRNDIEEAVVAGGFGGGDPARTRIRQSMTQLIKKGILKEMHGKLGRNAWKREQF